MNAHSPETGSHKNVVVSVIESNPTTITWTWSGAPAAAPLLMSVASPLTASRPGRSAKFPPLEVSPNADVTGNVPVTSLIKHCTSVPIGGAVSVAPFSGMPTPANPLLEANVMVTSYATTVPRSKIANGTSVPAGAAVWSNNISHRCVPTVQPVCDVP